MAKNMRLAFLFSINLLLAQYSYCTKREKRGISDFLIPGINVGDIALDSLKTFIYGTPVDKDQIILDKQLEHMAVSREILTLTHDIAIATENAPEMTVLIQSLQNLPKSMNSIDAAFRQFEAYEFTKRNSSDYQVREFAKFSNNRHLGSLKDINNLYAVLIPSGARRRTSKGDYSVLALLSRQMKGYRIMCDKFKSQRQMMQILLDGMTVAEIKVFLIMEYAIRQLVEIEQVNYQKEVDDLKEQLQRRFKLLSSTFSSFMKDASGEVWRCDPDDYIEGKTYFKLDSLFQLYLIEDSDINYASDCHYSCGDYPAGYETGCSVRGTYHDKRIDKTLENSCKSVRKCKGPVYDCSDKFAAYSELWTCPSAANSSRRYDLITHGTTGLFEGYYQNYGPLQNNPGDCNRVRTYHYRSWDHYLRNCELCACTCDDSFAPYSDSKINIRAATADKDYVVTGIKWVKKDNTLNLQIEQGKVLADGKVDVLTIHWKEIQEPRKKPAHDIVNFRYDQLRGFLLQDIQVAENHVVAGVKLEYVVNSNGGFVTLQLLPVEYDFESGKLNYRMPFYEDPDQSTYEEGIWDDVVKIPDRFSKNQQANLGEAMLPPKTKYSSMPVDKSVKYVLLQPSDFFYDVGQNTVPYFDMQENILNVPSPLSGIGIYLKKQNDYGGFLGLKLLTIDNADHIAKKL